MIINWIECIYHWMYLSLNCEFLQEIESWKDTHGARTMKKYVKYSNYQFTYYCIFYKSLLRNTKF